MPAVCLRLIHGATVVVAGAAGAAGTANIKPAEADRQRFQLHPSVNTWRTYDPNAAVNETASVATQIQSVLQVGEAMPPAHA